MLTVAAEPDTASYRKGINIPGRQIAELEQNPDPDPSPVPRRMELHTQTPARHARAELS
jgi:hypothetical protein